MSEVQIQRLLAPNPGPYTGAGTNTWIVASSGEALVIDPGPRIPAHEEAILRALTSVRTVGVVVTHGHEDHAPLANSLARGLSVPALGYGRAPEFEPDVLLAEGSEITFGVERLLVLATPGHSADHLCFRINRILFSGDHVKGGSSVMVEDLTRYLDSLRKLQVLELDRIYPGHGDEIEDPAATIDWYLAHRLQRERQIIAALEGGARTVEEIVEVVYADVDTSLYALARISVAAHLRKLEEVGAG